MKKHNNLFYSREKQRFSLRKTTIGLASVLLGLSFLSIQGQKVNADANTASDTVQTQEEVQQPKEDNEQVNSSQLEAKNLETKENNVSSTTEKKDFTSNEDQTSLVNKEKIQTPVEKANLTKNIPVSQPKSNIQLAQMKKATVVKKLSVNQESNQVNEKQPERVSVHDPSIFQDPKTGKFYIFGSHQAEAESDDLYNWKPLFKKEYEQPSFIFNNYDKDLAKMFAWAGHNDGDTRNGGYAIWAPDEVYNSDYRWKDGSKGAYMYYFSTSSSWIHSVIGFAVSKTVHGPYTFVSPVIYSGFTKDKTHNPADDSSKNDIYTNTNLGDLIKDGKIDGFSDKWVRQNDGSYNNDYAPNAIDVNIVTDKDNNLWMSYGSWSGGIYLLPLNKKTGMPIYPGKDSVNKYGQNVDRYFGTHLIGGFHESGEAPYIKYDKSTGYYYLFTTYGGLTRTGGYNIRLFRSKEIDGKYVDALGQHPVYTKWITNDTTKQENQKYGIKLEGNYDFSCLPYAYMSPGHNSAFIDKNGNWFLINHTRFDHGTEYHEIRVKQMIMTQTGWPIPLPFEYTGKEQTINADNLDNVVKQLTGNYEFVNNGRATSGEPIPKANVTLARNHQVEGDFKGTWSTSIKNNHIYLNIKAQDGSNYVGEFKLQQDESDEHKPVLVFAAEGNDEVIWGVKNYKAQSPSKPVTPNTGNQNSSTDFSNLNNNSTTGHNTNSENSNNNKSTNPLPEKVNKQITLTHNAYVYKHDLTIYARGRHRIILKAFSQIKPLDGGKKHTIRGIKFYRIGNNRYVKVSNTISYYKLIHNAFIYNKNGKAIKKHVKRVLLKKNRRIHLLSKKVFTIHNKKYYQIGSNAFVKINNVKFVQAIKN